MIKIKTVYTITHNYYFFQLEQPNNIGQTQLQQPKSTGIDTSNVLSSNNQYLSFTQHKH